MAINVSAVMTSTSMARSQALTAANPALETAKRAVVTLGEMRFFPLALMVRSIKLCLNPRVVCRYRYRGSAHKHRSLARNHGSSAVSKHF